MQDTDLHIYLNQSPNVETFSDLLSLYGFKYDKTVLATSQEPTTDYYKWKMDHVSDSGFSLLFFHTLFPDDLNFGKHKSFIIFSGDAKSSDSDLVLIDVFALLLLKRYGGHLHNPQKLDKISTSFLLSGKPFSGF